MGRPIIGITGELDAARWGDWLREAVISPVSYIRAVDRCGGAPVVLPPVPPPSVSAFIATLDGLVRVNQLGAGIWEVAHDWATLWCLALAYFVLAVISAVAFRRGRAHG